MHDWHYFLSADFVMHLFTHYGYWVIFVTVTLESMGLPLPAESLLAGSALLCATTHQLNVSYIALCGISAAIIGDNLGFLFGEHVGMPVIERYGPRFGLTHKIQAIAHYIFFKHGGSVIFIGRFISFLRMFISILAGAGGMQHRIFLFYNVLSAFAWGTLYTLIPYYLGSKIEHLTYGLAVGAVIAILLIASGLFILWRKKEAILTQHALQLSCEEETLPQQTVPGRKSLTHQNTTKPREETKDHTQQDSTHRRW